MTATAFILVLTGALCHAIWNIVAKKAGGGLPFVWLFGMVSIVVATGHMDGSVMIMLGEWAQHIVTFRMGAADFIVNVHWVYKAHVFLGMTLILIAPFTRLVHVWSIPVSYLWRPYQVVRRRQAALRYGARN